MSKVTRENLIPLLEKYYEAFIHEEDVWTFFLELAEYLELLDENEETNKILGSFNEQKIQDLKALNEIEQKAQLELDQSRDEMLKRIKKNKITSKALDYAYSEMWAMYEGRVSTSTPKVNFIDRKLRSILEALKELGKDEILDDFKGQIKTSYYPVDNYVFSKSLDEYNQLRGAMDFKEKTTLWYAWEHLQWAYLVIKKSDETLNNIKETKSYWDIEGFQSLMQEMHKIQSYKERINAYEKLNPVWFRKDEFMQFARRLHKHIIKVLLESNPDTHHLAVKGPSFDIGTGTLWINGKPVKFGTKGNPFHCLRVIFANKEEVEREWFFSEIAETIDEAQPKPDKLYHNYFNNTIKNKILAETGIKDFFITDIQSVRINEKYLEQKS